MGSPSKIFHDRLSSYFNMQIVLLCDGKCHCNVAKTTLRQSNESSHLKNFDSVTSLAKHFATVRKR